jgi:hypothetical protein
VKEAPKARTPQAWDDAAKAAQAAKVTAWWTPECRKIHAELMARKAAERKAAAASSPAPVPAPAANDPA